MTLSEFRRKLKGLDLIFPNKWEVGFVDVLPEKLLFILNYRGNNQFNHFASFALSLDKYNENLFPSKCWITSSSLKKIDDKIPSKHDEYVNFTYKRKNFSAYSVDLKDYKPQDPQLIKNLIIHLYAHIRF